MVRFQLFCSLALSAFLLPYSALAEKVVVVPLNTISKIISSEYCNISISGNGVKKYKETDSTVIDMGTTGGAVITQGAAPGKKNVMLPITYPSMSYGKRAQIVDFLLSYNTETPSDKITAVLLRRQKAVCISSDAGCYETLADYRGTYNCSQSSGCGIGNLISDPNYASTSRGLYLTIEMEFGSTTSRIAIGEVQLTIKYQ